MKSFAFYLLALISSVCFGQNQELWTQMKSKFPDAPAVFLERSEIMSILVRGDSLQLSAEVSEDVLHLKD
ncbi:MAG TPA: hypothetical protein VFE57_07495, partial [Cyclobacteriaceae bacterium]|nr:hypothetical protein [Cyclobacteriaceae bacterium]